jgi:cytidylate kinase
VRQTAETILGLAKLGNAILIGRGANIITARLDSVFHVRLVAPLETRLQRIQENEHLDRKAALAFIHREDRGRRRYLKKYYHQEINDPLLYHLIINTDLVGYDNAARFIRDCVMQAEPPTRCLKAQTGTQ